MSCIGHSQSHQQARIYVPKEHWLLVRPRCTTLEMQISCRFPSDCSTSLSDHLFGPRYSDTVEFHVLEWSWKCRIVAASLVLPFSVMEQSNDYFHWLMVSRRRPEKLRCIDWWSVKVSLNLRFGQKPVACWWRQHAVLTFLVVVSQSFRRCGATGVGL